MHAKHFAVYQFCPIYWDKQAWANSVHPDQMLHYAASVLSLHFATYSFGDGLNNVQ